MNDNVTLVIDESVFLFNLSRTEYSTNLILQTQSTSIYTTIHSMTHSSNATQSTNTSLLYYPLGSILIIITIIFGITYYILKFRHKQSAADEQMTALLKAENIFVEHKNLKLNQILGEGNFGKVYKAVLMSGKKEQEVAVKVINCMYE